MIYINGRFLDQPITGVQRYSYELFNALDPQLDGYIDWIDAALCCLTSKKTTHQPDWKNIPTQKRGRMSGNLWEQIDLPLLVGPRLLFSPGNIAPYLGRNQVVTIHDASVFATPYAYSFPFRLKYTTIINRLGRTSLKILTDSEFSKFELNRYCKIPLEKIEVIYLGGNHIVRHPPDESIYTRFQFGERPFFLAVGSNSLHKNFATALQAFSNAGFKDVDFVITGGDFSKVFRESNDRLPENVIKTGYISDQELRALYNRAVGLVYPSFYEGFGLPPLEAMTCGCPVICSNAASLPEVYGDAALSCDPHDTSSFTKHMKALLADSSLREELREKGLRRSGQFTWEVTAEKTWNILRKTQQSIAH